jgi:hypothetical protein
MAAREVIDLDSEFESIKPEEEEDTYDVRPKSEVSDLINMLI